MTCKNYEVSATAKSYERTYTSKVDKVDLPQQLVPHNRIVTDFFSFSNPETYQQL